ncbi:MAG: dicarboxylate/amino acid:cation symporter [Gemmatimonadota bacterium]
MRFLGNLTVQVLTAVALGVLLGVFAPGTAGSMRVLGDLFINLIRMLIAPIIFLTIVHGIASAGDLRRIGRVGGKALLYFEVVTTIALLIGLVVAHVVQPGAGLDPGRLAGGDVSRYTSQAHGLTFRDFFLGIVPTNLFDAFARGDIVQIVFVSVLFGVALAGLGERGRPLLDLFDRLAHVFFGIVRMVMRVAPIGAFGAMAYTVGSFGLESLAALGKLMAAVYATMLLFIFVALNLIARRAGFSLLEFLAFIKDELVITLGTSSSEAVLPRMLQKMERYGCDKSVVGLVLPTGYSFNLDGTSIYLSMGALFLIQVYHVNLSLGQEAMLLGILMLTSKGAAGVTGSGFIVLASTLSAMRVVPVEGIALLLGVDRFMSEARAITNLIGNGVATVVIARSEGAFRDGAFASRTETASTLAT